MATTKVPGLAKRPQSPARPTMGHRPEYARSAPAVTFTPPQTRLQPMRTAPNHMQQLAFSRFGIRNVGGTQLTLQGGGAPDRFGAAQMRSGTARNYATQRAQLSAPDRQLVHEREAMQQELRNLWNLHGKVMALANTAQHRQEWMRAAKFEDYINRIEAVGAQLEAVLYGD